MTGREGVLRLNEDTACVHVPFEIGDGHILGYALYRIVDDRGGLSRKIGSVYRLQPDLWQAHPEPMPAKRERDADPTARRISNFFNPKGASSYLLGLREREPYFDAENTAVDEAVRRKIAEEEDFRRKAAEAPPEASP